jgi:hypothetical protein
MSRSSDSIHSALPFTQSLDSGNESGGRNLKCVAEPQKGLECRRHVIIFKPADVGAIKVSVESQLFLRQTGLLTGPFENVAKHAGPLSVRGD